MGNEPADTVIFGLKLHDPSVKNVTTYQSSSAGLLGVRFRPPGVVTVPFTATFPRLTAPAHAFGTASSWHSHPVGHRPSWLKYPALQEATWHPPPLQLAPATWPPTGALSMHTYPHEPQFAASLLVGVSQPLSAVGAAGWVQFPYPESQLELHVPALHDSVATLMS